MTGVQTCALPILLSENEARVNVEVIIYNHGKYKISPADVKLDIYDTKIDKSNILSMNTKAITDFNKRLKNIEPSSVITILPHQVKPIKFTFKLDNIKLWRPAYPHLYSLGVKLRKRKKIIDEFYTQFGVREVAVDAENCKLLLNNKPIFLRGVARHEVFPGTTGGEDYEGIKGIYRDLLMIKDLNANFIRTAHYPNHPATYILTDRVGMLAWEEIPVFWFDGPQFDLQREKRKIAKQMWLQMIYRDYNRPSIIFWSTCNEATPKDKKERIAYIKDMHNTADLIDGTRLVVQSAVGNDPEDITQKFCDLAGITSYYGIFYGKEDRKSVG